MFKYLLTAAFAAWLSLSPASAQNTTCATRAVGDSTNACASTAFVQNAIGGIVPPTVIAVTISTNAALQVYVPTGAGQVIYRAGYGVPGDGGGAWYTYGTAACTIAGGDNGSQVQSSAATGCWTLNKMISYPVNVWGADSSGVNISDGPFVAWFNFCQATFTGAFGAAGGKDCFINEGKYKLGSLGNLVWDYATNQAGGGMIHGAGQNSSILDFRSFTGTKLVIESSVPQGVFYPTFSSFGVVGSNSTGPVMQIGLDNLTDAFNGLSMSYMFIKNIADTAAGVGLKINEALAGTFTTITTNSGCGAGNTGIEAFGQITSGTGYTNGTYNGVALTGGGGSGATANITVAGGVVTVVTLVAPGTNYQPGVTVSAAAASIGGTGSGFAVFVTKAHQLAFYGACTSTTSGDSLLLAAAAFNTFTGGSFSGGTNGVHFATGFNFANLFTTSDVEVTRTAFLYDSPFGGANTIENPQMVWNYDGGGFGWDNSTTKQYASNYLKNPNMVVYASSPPGTYYWLGGTEISGILLESLTYYGVTTPSVPAVNVAGTFNTTGRRVHVAYAGGTTPVICYGPTAYLKTTTVTNGSASFIVTTGDIPASGAWLTAGSGSNPFPAGTRTTGTCSPSTSLPSTCTATAAATGATNTYFLKAGAPICVNGPMSYILEPGDETVPSGGAVGAWAWSPVN